MLLQIVSRHCCHRNPLEKAPSSVLQACGKIHPEGRVLQQQSSVPAPVLGHCWDLPGQWELNGSSGAEEAAGGDGPCQPPALALAAVCGSAQPGVTLS